MNVQRCRWLVLNLVVFIALAAPLHAEVVAVEIQRREAFAEGQSFGDTGPYEKIVGVVRFEVDPELPCNRRIVDLDKAARNERKKVEFEADFCILAPKDLTKGNRAIFYDVNNRGNKLALSFFNNAPGGNAPSRAADAGDGFLFRRGYTVVWCGWLGELLPGGNRLLLHPPIAAENGQPIRGVVRQEMVADAPTDSLPLSRRGGHGSYPPTKKGLAGATLTWRMRETDLRVAIPRDQWSLEPGLIPEVKSGVRGTLPPIRLRLAGGFRLGYIYELIYEGEGPIVQGLGFAATRDFIAFLHRDNAAHNPLRIDGKTVLTRAYAFGVSQSGRFLRHFLYQGFNRDEKDRKVFDGMMPHVAGGGLGFFNHRFAQPNRHNGQHEDHLYPADVFPFTYGKAKFSYIRATDGTAVRMDRFDSILGHTAAGPDQDPPYVMHTQSAAEYWHRSGSLVHTDPLGTVDIPTPANVRIYAFGGTQHGPAKDPPSRGNGDNLANPGNYRPQLRALLDALDAWVRTNTEPPPSVYPLLEQQTLVDWHLEHSGFPSLPGVRYPDVIQQPVVSFLGAQFPKLGIISVEPPRIVGHYVVKVPKSDADGNDLGTLRPVEVEVPLATYTGWNLRRREIGAESMLLSLTGSYIPFARTKAERLKTGDPRPSIEERYGSYEEYRKRFAAACDDLVKRRLLLHEDAERLIAAREKVRGLFPK